MLKTEERNPKTTHIDTMTTEEMLKIINQENMIAVNAVEVEINNIAKAVDVISDAMKRGGRLFYIGCGTSGRLGVLDASECPPTFGVADDRVIGIIAGGDRCLRRAAENQEDIGEEGVNDLKKYSLTHADVVVGISAAGGAAYVTGALEYASSLGCTVIGITSNRGSKLDNISDISICTDTGAEVVTGSTRMKAGTAQKIVLNMLSTCAMIKQGYVYENFMINLKPSNIKLKKRSIGITAELSGKNPEEAEKALDAAQWDIKKAVELLTQKPRY